MSLNRGPTVVIIVNLIVEILDMEESSSAIQDDLMSRVNILKEDLHDADRRADNSERQVVFLLKKVQEQDDMITKYMSDYKGTGQFIDDRIPNKVVTCHCSLAE
eukprot:sb/3478083/